MSSTSRYLTQAIIAGVVAALALVGIRTVALAQWGAEPSSTETSSAAEPATTAPADPCSVITDVEAAEALGTTVSSMNDGALQCTHVAGDLSGRAVSVAVTDDIPDEDGMVEATVSQLATALDGSSAPIDLGQEAWVLTSTTMAQLVVRADAGSTVVVVVTLPRGSDAEVTALLSDLGQIALSRV